MILLLVLTTTPVFAEVTDLQTNYESFYKGDQIKFSGNVENRSSSLVSIVIRDFNNEFVMLVQAIINPDNSFEKTIKIGDRFLEHGIYNATGFILNMTKGITVDFGVSLKDVPIILKEKEIKNKVVKEDIIHVEKPKQELEIEDTITVNKIASFVDSSKEPQHYIDRYYNEALYKYWFDNNYPDNTIEEAVGYTKNILEIKSTVQELMSKEIIPEVQALSIVEPTQQLNNDSEISQISLTIAGLGILFGAVYGIKRKVDNNFKLISINRETIIKKIILPIIGSSPKDILQTRLAKGEITIEEYEKIKIKLY
ncbi:MAG: SHOCT domain-containing protein [Thaumarchaeota archaeon]|nr:SHOCT domain-containing protein [Nitrososphaerota archaeon]